MAKQNKTESETDAAAAAREAIANRPRQSVVRLVEYYNIVKSTAPERLEELFGNRVPELEAVASQVENPVDVAVEKARQGQLDIAVKALTNDDEKNGYANFQFDAELFAEKTRPKQPRQRKSVADKVSADIANASPEDLAALAAMLRAQGVEV